MGCCGCGGYGADLCVAHECLFSRAHACRLIKTDRRQCASPFGWTDQPETHYACSLRRQVPGVPSANLAQPQDEEKDCEARPPHSPLLRREGGNNLFHLLGVGVIQILVCCVVLLCAVCCVVLCCVVWCCVVLCCVVWCGGCGGCGGVGGGWWEGQCVAHFVQLKSKN